MALVADAELITPNVDTNDFGVFMLPSTDVAIVTQISEKITISTINGKSAILPTGSIVEIDGVSVNTCVRMIIIPVEEIYREFESSRNATKISRVSK